MIHAIKIIFITSILFFSPVLGLSSDAQIAKADSRCVGAGCVNADSAVKPSTGLLADFATTPVQLLLAGIVLIAIRIAAKKYLLTKFK